MSDTGTIGEQLRDARRRRGLNLLAASRKAPLSYEVLDRLERVSGAEVGADPRLQAQLRMYARVLGIDPEPLLRTALPSPAEVPDAGAEGRPLRPRRRRRGVPLRRVLAVAGVVALGAVAVATVTRLDPGGEPTVQLTPPATPQADAPAQAEAAPSPPAEPPSPTTASAPVPGRPPAETTVQLLDGVGDPERLAAAQAALESLGYPITVVDAMNEPAPRSVVYHTPGWREEAAGLAARDGRFSHAGANPGFAAEAALHVVVGGDWPQ